MTSASVVRAKRKQTFRSILTSHPHNQHISPTTSPIQRRKTILRRSGQRQPKISGDGTRPLPVISLLLLSGAIADLAS
jgi:hypothetical protein